MSEKFKKFDIRLFLVDSCACVWWWGGLKHLKHKINKEFGKLEYFPNNVGSRNSLGQWSSLMGGLFLNGYIGEKIVVFGRQKEGL